MYKPKPESWFIERINKRIYRDRWGCNCKDCEDVFKNGLIVRDKEFAEYLASEDVANATCGTYLNYRDKK